MSKSMLEAFCKAQYNALNAKDNKERIGYMIAGIKDGKFYDLSTGTDYGVFDESIPDTEFIPESALEIQRVTGAKLATFSMGMNKFFDVYGANPKGSKDVDGTDTDSSDDAEDERNDTVVDSTSVNDADSDSDSNTPKVDYEALEKACKKAIKKGDLKKAGKLLEKLVDQDCHKKLSKKLAKASK